MDLKGSKTAQALKDAFAGESQANRRYLYFAQQADVEGNNSVKLKTSLIAPNDVILGLNGPNFRLFELINSS